MTSPTPTRVLTGITTTGTPHLGNYVGSIRAALPCTLLLDPPPSIPVSIEISVAGVDYGKAHVTDCATEDGWRHLEPGLSIELCGAACRDYQSVGALTAHYRCSDDGGCC